MNPLISGQIVDVRNRRIFPAEIELEGGKIKEIRPRPEGDVDDGYIMPGFIDAHIHIESSMLVPSEFAKWAVGHGTVATVSDPHEIANVIGVDGIEFMIENGNTVPLKFHFGAPSCVPATPFETAGATLPPEKIRQLLRRDNIKYLAEMMNWPGVLNSDAEVLEKIKIAQEFNKVVDGHAPGLRGEKAVQYFAAGISTDHECTQYDEAVEKIQAGAKIAIREGSAAKNFEALHPLFASHPKALMLCSDDKHPDELMQGHINQLVIRALQKGYALFDVLHAACIHPIDHYGLNVGSLQTGDPADFLRVMDLRDFKLDEVYINGMKVCDKSGVLFDCNVKQFPERMDADLLKPEQIAIPAQSSRHRVIVAHDGELITSQTIADGSVNANGQAVSDADRDILKVVVYDRYHSSPPAVAFIRGFGLNEGALASSVAHDCHNIIAVGVSDEDIIQAMNTVIENKGGISFACNEEQQVLSLPVAGIMTAENGQSVADQYKKLDRRVKQHGSVLSAPYMTLSFMALLVIPSLKLSDQGLFDGEKFEFVDLFIKD
jgi:adenine deaminase